MLLVRCLPVALAMGLFAAGAAPAAEPTPRAAGTGKPEHAQDKPAPDKTVLTVAGLGGARQLAEDKAFFQPVAGMPGQTKALVLRQVSWNGDLQNLQQRAATGTGGWDLVAMEESTALLACRQGLLQTLDPAVADPADAGRCLSPAPPLRLVLAWDRSRVDFAPDWAAFWDVARQPGKRGLRRDPRGTLEIALLADGVAPDDVYKTLATPEGVDRAFRKLDQLKPYLVWWDTPAQAVEMIGSGAALMTATTQGEVAAGAARGEVAAGAARSEVAAGAAHRHTAFGVQWNQNLGEGLAWAIPTGLDAAHSGAARRLLAAMAAPQAQAAFAALYPAPLVQEPAKPSAAPAIPANPPAAPEPTATVPRDQPPPRKAADGGAAHPPAHAVSATAPKERPTGAPGLAPETTQADPASGVPAQPPAERPSSSKPAEAALPPPALRLDATFWAANYPSLHRRFEVWLAR